MYHLWLHLLSVALSNNRCFHPLGGGQGTPIDAKPAFVRPPLGVRKFLIFKRIMVFELGILIIFYI